MSYSGRRQSGFRISTAQRSREAHTSYTRDFQNSTTAWSHTNSVLFSGSSVNCHFKCVTNVSVCSTLLTLSADNIPALHARLCAEELVIVTIDSRTGYLNLRES